MNIVILISRTNGYHFGSFFRAVSNPSSIVLIRIDVYKDEEVQQKSRKYHRLGRSNNTNLLQILLLFV